MKAATPSYWSHIPAAVTSLYKGLRLTLVHMLDARKSRVPSSIKDNNYFTLQEGIATVQYPHEMIPVPDNGRYQLHNEIDDCIVCDKCVKVCPVNCITIEPIKSQEEFGKTSDGTPKRIYAAKFDIDMAKCCFCGLCTTVCPTECLTMTKKFDFSTFDIKDHNFEFAEMTEAEIIDKKQKWEEHQKIKTAAALQAAEEKKDQPVTPTPPASPSPASPGKPVFRPKIKPSLGPSSTDTPS